MSGDFRVGTGYDAHALGVGIPLYIGGVKIAHDKGLIGHSDGDVLLHAIVDAIFGALNQGDLGDHFSSTEARWKGARSTDFVSYAARLMRDNGFSLVYCDAIVIAQKPILKPYVTEMRTLTASALDCSVDRISIKATTTDHLGFTGREEGMAAQAICLLKPSSAK